MEEKLDKEGARKGQWEMKENCLRMLCTCMKMALYNPFFSSYI